MSTLEDVIARVRGLKDLPELIAKEARPLIDAEAKRTAAAGTSPTGEAWTARKDGKRALVNAASAIVTTVRGGLITIALRGTSTGPAKVQAIQNATRPILPKHSTKKGGAGEGVPPRMSELLVTAARRVTSRVLGGSP